MARNTPFWMATFLVATIAWPSPVHADEADPALAAHTDEFRQEVITVTDGVHVAVGYGLANSILIEGPDGVIIVDTMESARAANSVKEQFDKITNKPVKALVYTHSHYDHIMGARCSLAMTNPRSCHMNLPCR